MKKTIGILHIVGLILFLSIQPTKANPVLTPGVWKDISPEHAGGDV